MSKWVLIGMLAAVGMNVDLSWLRELAKVEDLVAACIIALVLQPWVARQFD